MSNPIASVIGQIPNRLALAGGWIDQPFVSRHNPKPLSSMVVVQIEPTFRPMDRAGIASGTRAVAMKLWRGKLPKRPPADLVRELYEAENKGKAEPSGSQDMIGLIYPGINRLDYDFAANGGVFPAHIESLTSSRQARWLERVLHILPIEPRPDGYNPLGKKISTRNGSPASVKQEKIVSTPSERWTPPRLALRLTTAWCAGKESFRTSSPIHLCALT